MTTYMAIIYESSEPKSSWSLKSQTWQIALIQFKPTSVKMKYNLQKYTTKVNYALRKLSTLQMFNLSHFQGKYFSFFEDSSVWI